MLGSVADSDRHYCFSTISNTDTISNPSFIAHIIVPSSRALSHFPHAPAFPLTAPSASPTRPPRQGTPYLSSVSLIRGFAASVSSSLGSPPLTQRPQVGAATGMPWGRNAAGRTYSHSSIQKYGKPANQFCAAHQAAEGYRLSAQERRQSRALGSAAHGGRARAFCAKGQGQIQAPRLTPPPRQGLITRSHIQYGN